MEGILAKAGNRQPADLLLFGVTLAELLLLLRLTPGFTFVDWIYVSQHLLVLVISLLRRPPAARDVSLTTSLAVVISYGYPYAQMILLHWEASATGWPEAGAIIVTLGACLSLVSLVTLGRSFGVRPALRVLRTKGSYRLVRHPIYLSYVLADIGYQLQGWNIGTLSLVALGWASLLYRIAAEERILSKDAHWHAYADVARYRLLPGIW